MSRVGKSPIQIPASATVVVDGDTIRVKGPRGELEQKVSNRLDIEMEEDRLLLRRRSDEPVDRSLHGLFRTLVNNMVTGVTDGFEKVLEIEGVGYRANLKGKDIELQLGFSEPKLIKAPNDVEFEVPNPNRIVVKGCDKQRVGQVAADIRSLRKPDPYKGKGIRYQGEHIRRKVGKAIK